jgi:hypothetical protein
MLRRGCCFDERELVWPMARVTRPCGAGAAASYPGLIAYTLTTSKSVSGTTHCD